MAITSLTKHDDHEVRIHLCRGSGPHYAALRCVPCNRHIQWLSSSETHLFANMGVAVWKHFNSEGLNGRKYLDFPAEPVLRESKDFWL